MAQQNPPQAWQSSQLSRSLESADTLGR
jgi:hypothetical protein